MNVGNLLKNDVKLIGNAVEMVRRNRNGLQKAGRIFPATHERSIKRCGGN
jgi:hypothetical protein